MRYYFIKFLYIVLLGVTCINPLPSAANDLKDLTTPIHNDAFIKFWAKEVAENTLSFSFATYRKDVSKSASKFFTDLGTQRMAKTLHESGILDAVKEDRAFLKTITSGDISISSKEVRLKERDRSKQITERQAAQMQVYSWTVNVPVTLTYEFGSQRIKDDKEVMMRIERNNDADNPYSVAVTLFAIR